MRTPPQEREIPDEQSSPITLLLQAMESLREEQYTRIIMVGHAEKARRRHHAALSTALRDVAEQARVRSQVSLARSLRREEIVRKEEERRIEDELKGMAREWLTTRERIPKAVEIVVEEMRREEEMWDGVVRRMDEVEQANQREELMEALQRAKEAMASEELLTEALSMASEATRTHVDILCGTLREEEGVEVEVEDGRNATGCEEGEEESQQGKQKQGQEGRKRTQKEPRRKQQQHGAEQKGAQEEKQRGQDNARRQREDEARRRAEEEARNAHRKAKLHKARKDPQEVRRLALIVAWADYEKRWYTLPSVPSLTFALIPWPVVSPVSRPEQLQPALIADFILSPEHSHNKSRRHRIHAALLRWHTDHFDGKFMGRVVKAERKAVHEGVGRVVRCLNEMLAGSGDDDDASE